MSPEQLLQDAQRKGITQLALTDINNTSGILDFFRLAEKYQIKPIAGIDFRNASKQQFIGIARNMAGFKELNDYLSEHLKYNKNFEDAPPFNNAFIIYPFSNTPQQLRENEFVGIRSLDLNKLVFSHQRFLKSKLVILHPVTFLQEDTRNLNGRTVTFRSQHIYQAHRLLRAMQNNTLLTKIQNNDLAGENEIILHEQILKEIFCNYPSAIENTLRILNECSIDFQLPKSKNKKFFIDADEDEKILEKECRKGMKYRYGSSADAKIEERYLNEIKVIREMGFTSYFLINWNIVRYAQFKNFFYVGRGSGANSMVAYLLRITDVDPIDLDLYFERFINPSRKNPPDFDIDFSSSERDEIIKYIFKTYGEEYVALLATYSTLQDNSVIRELGKVYGLPKDEIDNLSDEKNFKLSAKNYPENQILDYGNFLKDFPSHLSIHAGGILISEAPIHNYTATSFPPKGFPLTQFSMLEAEDVGLNKFDILAQRGLGKIKDAVEIVKQNQNKELDIHNINEFKVDKAVQNNLETANLMGCFYVESPAMRMLLKKLKAKSYLDLVAASSIIRPGVAQSGMMREYILRFHDKSRRVYPNQLMEDILGETFGVMVYQEDVIKVAHLFAGLSLEDADKLRRGMGGKYRGREEFAQVKEKFFVSCRQREYDEKLIAEVWRQMESFGGYAFAKGHSASYAVESYQCMYLKTYYPLEFMVAVINNGGGFYAPEFYVHEARKHGATIHAPDINLSHYHTVIRGSDIYLGLWHIKEMEQGAAEKIFLERNHQGHFQSLDDFVNRVDIALEQIRILIRIGAFRFTGRTKQQLLWDIYSLLGRRKKTTVKNELFPVMPKKFKLPPLENNKIDDGWDEMEILGFSLCSPFELLRDKIPSDLCAADLKTRCGKEVSIVGRLVTRKVAITKHGQPMSFGTFLDKEGEWIDTTHFPDVLKQYPFLGSGCYLITGKVTEEFGFYSIDVTKMEKLQYLQKYETQKAQ